MKPEWLRNPQQQLQKIASIMLKNEEVQTNFDQNYNKKLWNFNDIVKFVRNCEICSKLWNLVTIDSFRLGNSYRIADSCKLVILANFTVLSPLAVFDWPKSARWGNFKCTNQSQRILTLKILMILSNIEDIEDLTKY